jgi:hypothetical protein
MPTTTTPGALRDYIVSLIASITPTINSKDRFIAHHNERDGDFLEAITARPVSSFRRFQVRDDGKRRPPEVTNTEIQIKLVTFLIYVAYPQTSRTGKDNALDRDDAMDADATLIEKVIGLSGYANFAGANPNATFIDSSVDRQKVNGCDLLVISQTFRYFRAIP